MKKTLLRLGMLISSAAILLTSFSACGTNDNGDTGNANKKINVVSREEGSGTRGAFIELFGIEEKDSSGNKIDNTTLSAEITNSTSVMMTTITGNKSAIGYISLGSLNDTVKALKVDGAVATADNIKNGSYKISRPFNIATKTDISELAQDFINYIMSAEGQAVVEKTGYISEGNKGAYSGTKPSGKITIAGSSSVTPVMEKLKEEYIKINSGATIEIQQNDSTTGTTSAIDGLCDIGMASREIKDSEIQKGLTATVIAMDGIAVIVNKNNSINEITSTQVKDIYTEKVTTWGEING